VQLSSATPLAETENLDVYPAAHEGFDLTSGAWTRMVTTPVMSHSLYHFAQKLFKE
jgi:hypothetical protein